MAPLRFILIFPPSEVGIYVEEMSKQSILRILCCWISLLFTGKALFVSLFVSLLKNDVLLLSQRASTINRVDSFKSVVSSEK